MTFRTRLVALLGIAVAAIAAGTVVGATPAFAFSGVEYVNNGSAKCVTADAAGVGVVQWTCSRADNQGWTVIGATANGNPFQIQSTLTGRCLDITSFSNAAPVVQVDCAGQPTGSYWKFVRAGNREFPFVNLLIIQSAFFNYCLDLENGDRSDGVPMQVWQCNSRTNNQIWYAL